MTNENSNGSSNKPLEPEQFRKMFIGGLSLNTTDDMLKEYYGQWGELLDYIVMKDPQTKRSRCFGFVTFSSQAEVDKAMAARPHTIDGKTIEPKRAVPREQSAKAESNMSTKRLYVSGIRDFHTEDILKEYFSQFGNVETAEIIREKSTGKPRGFAFVNFDDYDSVDKCVLQRSHMIKEYRCDVKKALSKEEAARAQQLDKDRSFRGDRSRGSGRSGPGGPGGYSGPAGYGGPGGPGPWGPPSGPPQGGWGGWGPQGGYGGGGGGGGGGYEGYGGGGYGGGWGGGDTWSQGGQGAQGGQGGPNAWGPPSGWQQSWGPPQGGAPQAGPGGWSQGPTGGWGQGGGVAPQQGGPLQGGQGGPMGGGRQY